MSAHGISTVYFFKLDDTGKIIKGTDGLSDTGIYEADGNNEGFTSINITGLEVAGTNQWANDKIKRVTHGKAEPKVALTALDLDHDILMKMKGYSKDSKGGFIKGKKKPHIAMLVVSTGFDNETKVYEGLANTEIIEEASNHSTDNNNESDSNTTLSADVLNPLDPTVFADPNDPEHQEPYKIWFSDETGFDLAAILKEVGGGYTAVDGGSSQSIAATTTTTTANS
ncbi:phage tail protein [Lactobacillus sp. ESL0791]|uniref:phage tail protein n=1 Tax=Lactobacillus sp. ESL0791 TaxID=2983234 RepID=UPI0023F92971|nr:phage tail protein [Lactobacillus sp. ESL0791]MDF7639962.1 phage tail protein [Lactobacillus sp. ESL0791]